MIKICTLQLKNISMNLIDRKLLNFLSTDKKIKTLKYSSELSQKLSLYSNLLLRKQLIEIFNIPNFELNFYYPKNEKPIFLNNPSYDFSISHTNNYIISVISNNSIGCDVEKIRNFPLELTKKIFHPLELEYMKKSSNKQEQIKKFFEIWTKKEAYSKCKGNGIYNNLKSLNTQQKSLKKNFLSWKQNEYIFSIFSYFFTDISYENITEKDIVNYFLNKKHFI